MRLHPRLRPLLRLAVPCLLAGIVTAALTGAPAQARAADPGFEEPAVGTCYDLTLTDLGADSVTKSAVDCAGDHTAMVLATKRIPASQLDDPAKVDDLISGVCWKSLATVLGSNDTARSWTNYSWSFFMPTDAQRAEGASWASCQVHLIGNTKALDIPAAAPFLVGTTVNATVKHCLVGQDQSTTCTLRHTYRAVKPFRLTAYGHGFPTRREARAIAADQCTKRASKVYYFSYPEARAWAQGYRMMVCFKKTQD